MPAPQRCLWTRDVLIDAGTGVADQTLEELAAIGHEFLTHALWPDFTVIPSRERPYLRFAHLDPGASVELGGRTIRSIPVTHSIPAVGYRLATAAPVSRSVAIPRIPSDSGRNSMPVRT